MRLSDSVFIRLLLTLRLPAADYVVLGSAPLLAVGLKSKVHDLDIVARGEAWRVASECGSIEPARSGRGLRIVLFGGDIEVFDHWIGFWHTDVDALIDSAQLIDGVPFLPLVDTLAWKRGLGRAKDICDIALIEHHLAVPAR